MNPLDPRTVFLAKHAQHVVLIHFPIALFIVGVLFDFLAQWRKEPHWRTAAYYNLLVAAASTIPVVVTGIVAWQWAMEGERLKGLLLWHLVLGGLSATLICAVWIVHARTRRTPGAALPRYLLLLELAAVGVVTVTGHLGGFLSGVNVGY